MDWILLRSLVQLEHLAVLIMIMIKIDCQMGMGIASECTTVSVWGSLGRVRSKCIQVVPAPFYQPKDKSLFHFLVYAPSEI